jgi:hypothetical protein
MHVNARMVGAGVAAAVAASVGYLLLHRDDDLEFQTAMRDGAYSVRRYPRLLVAETVEWGLRESALSRGFKALADFLGSAPMPMTVPVLADGDDDGRGWRTRLVIPARFGAEMLPEPADGVALRELAPRTIAAVRFAGEADDGTLARHEGELRDWMETRGLSAAGPAGYAFYNSPFTPAPLKRSEVLIPLAA